MTDREKAIVMAYTGVVMLIGDKINEYYKYLQELFNRPIYPHEIFFLEKEIKEKAEGDFIRLCDETDCDVESLTDELEKQKQINETLTEKLDMIEKILEERGV